VKETEKDTATESTGTESTDTAVEVKPKRTRKPRKGTGFMLLINCAPMKNVGDDVTSLHSLLVDLGAQMAAEIDDAETFYDIHAFDRRDALRKAGKAVAEGLSGIVVADGVGTGESDLKALVDALRPFATVIITPVV
jgi:hypothetical protein